MSGEEQREVVVLGGGPAGAVTAALLADAGHDVLVVERERFPRFHIGESLLPLSLRALERLGLDLGGGEYLRKAGAVFLDDATDRQAVFRFADGLPGTPDHAWQVERSRFDALLLERAARGGAEVREARVRDVEPGPDDVRIDLEGGDALRARFFVDASGQGAFLARRMRSQAPYPAFGRAAVFCHVEGLAPAAWEELSREGNILVLVSPLGWGWAIPLAGAKLSVGLVQREGPLREDALSELLDGSPTLARLTAGARRGPVRRIGDFSFKNLRPTGPRWACVGDAACFLDPVFSSGVSLALAGAEGLADALGPALREGREHEPARLEGWLARMDVAYQAFAQLIYRFYHTRMVQNLFFSPSTPSPMRAGIVSVLAGDVWRDDNPFQAALLQPARHGAVEPVLPA